MKHYRRFRIGLGVAHLVIDIILAVSVLYLVWLIYPTIPIYD